MAILSNSSIRLRLAPIFGMVMLATGANIIQAQAQSAACDQLQSQLDTLNSSNTNRAQPSPRYRQYHRAVKDQRGQIQKTRRMALRNGCSGNFSNARNSSTCGRIVASLEQMGANLTALEGELQRLAPAGINLNSGKQKSLIRAMNQRGCFATNNLRQTVNLEPRRRSLIEQIFGVRTFSNDGRRGLFERGDENFRSRYNTYRTMCVRKQDGYYFPISFSTTPDRFEFDQRVCQSKCQGTDVALYFHGMPQQDSEDMVSYIDQTPYTDLPNAFAYRKKFDANATCRYSSGILEEIAGFGNDNQELADIGGSLKSRIGKPVFRRDRSLDPESLTNLAGLFDDKDMKALLAGPQDESKSQKNDRKRRKVRVVGPAFYPVQ